MGRRKALDQHKFTERPTFAGQLHKEATFILAAPILAIVQLVIGPQSGGLKRFARRRLPAVCRFVKVKRVRRQAMSCHRRSFVMTFKSAQRFVGTRLVSFAVAIILISGSFLDANAQSVLSFTGQLRSAYPQSTLAEPIAAVERTCSSISSKSRRCFFTFFKECQKRGESKEHCTRMSGFCHSCTDAYATCKGDQNVASQKAGAKATDCSTCNVAYGRCINRMVEQYGGKLIKAK
jgi:hypothetical protein